MHPIVLPFIQFMLSNPGPTFIILDILFLRGDVESRVIRVMPKPDVVRRSSESIFKTHHSPQSQLHSPPSLFLFLFCWPFY